MVIPLANNNSSCNSMMVIEEQKGEEFADQQIEEFYNTNITWIVPVDLRVPYDAQDSKTQYYAATTKSINSVTQACATGTPLPKDCPLHVVAIKHDKEKWTKVAQDLIVVHITNLKSISIVQLADIPADEGSKNRSSCFTMSHLGAQAGIIDLNPDNAAPNQNNLVLKIENLEDEIEILKDQLDALRSEIKSLNDYSSLECFFKSYRVFYILLILLCCFVQAEFSERIWSGVCYWRYAFSSFLLCEKSPQQQSSQSQTQSTIYGSTRQKVLSCTSRLLEGSSVTVQLRNFSTSQRNQQLL